MPLLRTETILKYFMGNGRTNQATPLITDATMEKIDLQEMFKEKKGKGKLSRENKQRMLASTESLLESRSPTRVGRHYCNTRSRFLETLLLQFAIVDNTHCECRNLAGIRCVLAGMSYRQFQKCLKNLLSINKLFNFIRATELIVGFIRHLLKLTALAASVDPAFTPMNRTSIIIIRTYQAVGITFT